MAGGKSSRFGADKLTSPFRGELLVFGALSS
ncbi:MAG: nucleotidyltransferase family protein, partial [Thermovibrio sp.]